MPDVWCQGLNYNPNLQSWDKSDPTNYRGICVSSCLGKLFCSIWNRRLHMYFEENNILHNSQIGLLPENRTADHVFTLRTLIDKYVHYHKEKVYACFVDFRKAFDSVWHEGLFYKLLKTNIGGNLYNLMKSLYCNSTCSIKIGENKTQPFSYSRGVRQGCILSPLLFNLYLNNLPHLVENIVIWPICSSKWETNKFTFVRRWFSYSIKIVNWITELFKCAFHVLLYYFLVLLSRVMKARPFPIALVKS